MSPLLRERGWRSNWDNSQLAAGPRVPDCQKHKSRVGNYGTNEGIAQLGNARRLATRMDLFVAISCLTREGASGEIVDDDTRRPRCSSCVASTAGSNRDRRRREETTRKPWSSDPVSNIQITVLVTTREGLRVHLSRRLALPWYVDCKTTDPPSLLQMLLLSRC